MSKDEFSKIIKLEGILILSEISALSPAPASQRFFWKEGITRKEIPHPPSRRGNK
jgi:hypothetical protein